MKVVLVGLDTRTVDFHLDDIGIDAIDRGAKSFVEHRCGFGSFFHPHVSEKSRRSGGPHKRH
jgi:hypothetical protein